MSLDIFIQIQPWFRLRGALSRLTRQQGDISLQLSRAEREKRWARDYHVRKADLQYELKIHADNSCCSRVKGQLNLRKILAEMGSTHHQLHVLGFQAVGT